MDIEAMAREAGIQDPETYHGDPSRDRPWIASTGELGRFAAIVADECAKIAADIGDYPGVEAASESEWIVSRIRAKFQGLLNVS